MSPQFVKLDEVAETSSGGTPSRGNKGLYGGDIPWIKSGELPDGEITEVEESITQLGLENSSAKRLPAGTLVIAMYGATVGKLGILTFPAATNQAVCAIVPSEKLHRDYLFYWLLMIRSRLVDKSFGGAQPNISQTVIRNLEIPLIKVEEQARIAGYIKSQLTEVEKARQATDTAFSDVESLKAAVFRTTFKQIVPVAPPKNLPIAPDGWQWKKLTDIAELESGHTPSRFRPDWWGGDISWVSLTEIRSLDGMWVEETQLRTNKDGIANSSARILPKGTVCFSRTASVGFVAIMAKPMATSQDFANWVCGKNLDPEFLMYALLRSRDNLRAIAEGATHKTIYMPALHSFHICVPDPSEQRSLVASLREELKSIELVRLALEKQLSELKQLPNRILAQAFES